MSVAIIIDRIRASLAAGELAPKPKEVLGGRQLVMGDLVRPYAEVFPGIDFLQDGDDWDCKDIFGWGPDCLRKPGRLNPSPRRSLRPLPAPRRTAAPVRLVNPGIFISVAGIWDWYQAKGLAVPGLLDGPFTRKALAEFVEPLWAAVSDYYPMGVGLEDIGCDNVLDLRGICLILPHTSYDEESAGVVEAFLSGVESIASMITEYHDRDAFLDIPAEDEALIQEHGIVEIIRCYADFQGEKSVDIAKLDDFGNTFFGKVWQRFPQWETTELPIISGNGGDDAEIPIRSAQHIDFCLAYADAYEEMMAAMPYHFDFEYNEDRVVDRFVHELCEVWRRVHGLPSVELGASYLRNSITGDQ